MKTKKHAPVLTTNLAAGTRLLAHLCAEALDLVDDETFHALNRVFVFKAEVERLLEVLLVSDIQCTRGKQNVLQGRRAHRRGRAIPAGTGG